MYEYADEETRPPSALRTNQLARECLAVVEAVGVPGCKGHKHEPLIAKWPGMDWYRMCPNELVHDTKIFVEMLCKTLVGKLSGAGFYNSWSYDAAHRRANKPNKRHISLDVARHQRATSVAFDARPTQLPRQTNEYTLLARTA